MTDRSLHIGVDARELLGKRTGVGRYLWHVIREWTAGATWRHRLSLFAPGPEPDAVRSLGSSVAWIDDGPRRPGTWWEQSRLPRLLSRASVDVLFAPGYTAPLRLPCPFVVGIYDVSFFAHPEWFGAREGWRRRWLTARAARRAHRIITCSEFSASEIVRWIGVPRERIVVGYPGAMVPAAASVNRPRDALVLFAGSLFTRRRIPELIAGFAQVARRHPDARLVLVGDNRTQPPIDPVALAAEAGVSDRVEWRAYVDDEALAALYGRARVFAFLSDYEGFGIPPLEALAHGVPPVLLDTPVSREAYLGAARLVDAAPASIAGALESLLTDPHAHHALVEGGRKVLARFRWDETAAVVRGALEDAALR